MATSSNALNDLDSAANSLKGMLQGGAPKEESTEQPPKEAKKKPIEQPEIEAEVQEEEFDQPDTETAEETGQVDDQEDEAPTSKAEPEADEEIQLDADQFAALLGLESEDLIVNDDGQIRLRTKVDGEESDATLNDLLERYQRDAHLTNRGKKLSEQEKQLKTKLESFTQETTRQAQQAAILLEAIDQQFNRDYQSIDWKALQQEDPGEYAAKKVEFGERKAQKDQLIQQTLKMLEDAQQTAAKEQAELMQKKLLAEQQSMQATFKKMGVKIDKQLEEGVLSYMTDVFGEALDTMAPVAPLDKLAILAYKAMQFDKGTAKASDKRVKKLPKVLKPGQKPSTHAVKINVERKLKANLKKSGSMDDAVALLRQRFSKE